MEGQCGATQPGAQPSAVNGTGTSVRGASRIWAGPGWAGPTWALPSGALPNGALPSGALPSGALPSGALPSGALADGKGRAVGTLKPLEEGVWATARPALASTEASEPTSDFFITAGLQGRRATREVARARCG